jgi:formylglycine-generating enzyme required for sulfatase activity
MLTKTIKEIAKSRDADATQIAEVLWLSQFMESSKKQKKLNEKNSRQRVEKETQHLKETLPKTVVHKVIINSGQQKDDLAEDSFEQDKESHTKFSIVVPKKEKLTFNLDKQFEVLKSKVKKENAKELNEEETAEYLASSGIFNPIFKKSKVRENSFTLQLIIEQNSSMFLWQESIEAFVKNIKKTDAFKSVNIFYLDSSQNHATFKKENSIKHISYKSSLFKRKKTLTLVLSDVVGKAWRSNYMFNTVFQTWTKYSFVTIVSMLPYNMWQKTPLRQGVSLFVTSNRFPVSNHKLKTEYTIDEIKNQLNIPIIPFEEESFSYLSNLLMAKKESWIDARIFTSLPDLSSETEKPISSKSPKERVDKFFASAHEEARTLAIYCSILPLNRTIIEAVIHYKSLGNMDAFAEFYFGGLLDKSIKNEIVEYEFFDGVRKELIEYISVEEAKSLFYIVNDVASDSLGLNGSLVDLLFANSEKNSKLSSKEKEIVQLLKNILAQKGKFFKKEIDSLRIKKDTIHPKTNTYQMGSTEYGDEQPIHQITFDYDFAIAKTPVTFEEYDLYCEAKGIEKPSDKGWGRGKRPVINVSWHDANDYCQWLSDQTGHNYRLPTEAEWEYACRAGTNTKWSFGDDEKKLEKYAWYENNSNNMIHPVSEKEPNPWGLYDMHGNVWEWCLDDWVDNYNETPRDGTAYKHESSERKVVRGGSWNYDGYFTRSAYRDDWYPDVRYISRGFRILRTLP